MLVVRAADGNDPARDLRVARVRARARRPGLGRAAARQAAPRREGRQDARSRDRRARAGGSASSATARRSTGRTLTDDERVLLGPVFLLTNKPVLVVVNVGVDQLDDADALASPFGDDALAVCIEIEGDPDVVSAEGAERAQLLADLGVPESVVPAAGPLGAAPPRAPHVPDDRRQGDPGLDVPRRRDRAGVRRRHPLGPPARLHPGRGDPLERAARARLVGEGEGEGQAAGRGQGLRRRRRRRRSRSDSTSRSPDVPVLVRDGVMLGAAEVAAGRPARRRGLLGRDGIDGVIVLEPCRQVHTFGMRFPIDVAFCAADGRVLRIVAEMVPGRVSRVVWRARRRARGRGRSVPPLGAAPRRRRHGRTVEP